VVQGAASPEAWRWLGRLDALGAAEPPATGAPGLLVIGAVAALASQLQGDLGSLAVPLRSPKCG
jgi:hypothetical protein